MKEKLGEEEQAIVGPSAQEVDMAVVGGEEEQAKPTDWKPRRLEYLIMACLSFISLMVALDASVLVSSLPAITSALNGTANDGFWAGTSYLLTSSIFQPFLAGLSDIFGRQHMLCLSIFLFLVGTILCCVANEFTVFLAGRSIQGIGGGGIMSLVLIVFSDIVPLRQRPIYVSYIQVAWALGTISGPVLGGAIVQNTTWRWIFYINFPFCVFGLVTIPLVLRLTIVDQKSLVQKLLAVDWLGGVFFNSSMAIFLIGLTWGGVEYPWVSYQTLLPLFLGAAGVAVTMVWEGKYAKNPFIRLNLFTNRSVAAVYVSAIIQGLILFGSIYYTAFYFESVKAYSPLLAGVGLIPTTAGMVPMTAVIGHLVSRWGRYRWAIWIGWVLTILGSGLLISWDVETPPWKWVLCLLVLGFGHGMIISTPAYIVQVLTSNSDGPYALALYTSFRTLGMCLGLAIGGTAFQNFLRINLADAGLPTSIAPNAEAYLKELLAYPSSSPYRIEVVALFAKSFRSNFALFTGISVIGGLAALFIQSRSMDRSLDSRHVLKRKP